jgi:L,D-transpeptidase YcbB
MKNYFRLRNRLFYLLLISSVVLVAAAPALIAALAETVPVEAPDGAATTETAPPAEAAAPTVVAVVGNMTVPTETAPPLTTHLFQQAVKQMLPRDGRLVTKLASRETIYRKRLILKMYQDNDQHPLWTPISIQSLSDALSVLSEDGLNPNEYQFDAIKPYLNDPNLKPQTTEETARIDILLTEAYLRALYHLDYGKVDPERLDADHNFASAHNDEERSPLFLSWVQKGRIDLAFDWVRPKSDRYTSLKAALISYQKIMAAGGWPVIPSGKAIKLGGSDSRIPLIRARLSLTGDLASPAGPAVFDEELEQAVRKFQTRHDMKVDAVVGPSTIVAMNKPVERRVDQIRINLERERWYFPKALDEYLLVDAAGFKVYWMKDNEVIWQELVQVGKRFTSTPIFRDQIEHIDFNPTWSVPPGINKRTILPSLKVDASYLDKKGYQLLDSTGEQMDPRNVDWDEIEKMPYTVRQPPGWSNALGKVKFMFPNKHSVFLHDTNHRDYFAKKTRTTSSGCIRLRNPFVFAERLLGRQGGWDRARIDDIVATNRTTRVNLEKPLPILIQYSTVAATEGEVTFRTDMYRRDAKLLAALDGSFEIHLPDLPKTSQARIRSMVKSASASAAKFLSPEAEIIGEPVPDYSSYRFYQEQPRARGSEVDGIRLYF